MTRPQIIERLGQDETFMDEKKFGRAMTELKRWGLQNVPKKGYRIVLESK